MSDTIPFNGTLNFVTLRAATSRPYSWCGANHQITICPLAGDIQSAYGAFHTTPDDAKTHRFPCENGGFIGAGDLTRAGPGKRLAGRI